MDFFDAVIEQMPFAIQRIQTDRGREFFAIKFQEQLLEWGIKFRPIKPASPQLNGNVERSQRTDLDEFCATVDPRDPELHRLLAEWQHYYNWDRSHSSLEGKTLIERLSSLADKVSMGRSCGELRPVKRAYPGAELSCLTSPEKIEMMSANHTFYALNLSANRSLINTGPLYPSHFGATKFAAIALHQRTLRTLVTQLIFYKRPV